MVALRGGDLNHVRIEYADTGVHGWNLTIANSEIRNSRGPGISGKASVSATDVVSACAGQDEDCAAIMTDRYAQIDLTDVVVEASNGAGVARGRRGHLVLENVTIKGSAGVGLDLNVHVGLNDQRGLDVRGDLRIVDNLYPAAVVSHDIPDLLPTAEAQNRLLGNERDTLLVGLRNGADLTVWATLPWRVSDAAAVDFIDVTPLDIEPGATIAATDTTTRIYVNAGRRIEGTPEDPVTFSGISLWVWGGEADTTRLRNVRFVNGALASTFSNMAGSPVVLENAEVDDARIELGAAGSRIDGLTARGGARHSASDPEPLLRLTASDITGQNISIRGADGVGIELSGANILLSACEVTGSAGAGIRVLEGAGIQIRVCNLQDNAGEGLLNLGSELVDAIENWWGDVGGPEGPDGDGIDGEVRFDPWRTAPADAPGG